MPIFKDNFLKGKTALITGGGSGICKEIALYLGKHGANIFIVGRREEVLKETCQQFEKEGIKARFYSADVRDFSSCKESVEACLKEFNSLEILINGAAGNFLAPAEKLSANGFGTVIDIDVKGTFNMSRASFEALKTTENSVILNISATLHYQGTLFQSHVMSAKAAIDALGKSLATEWAKDGIRVVGIAPGPIGDTEGMRRLAPGKKQEDWASRIPLGRLGQKIDIANAALFLVSEAAAFITGETLVVDGGEWLYKKGWVSYDEYEKLNNPGSS